MGRILVSECKWGMGDVAVHPVIVRNAAFWDIWSLFTLAFEMGGNQAVEA